MFTCTLLQQFVNFVLHQEFFPSAACLFVSGFRFDKVFLEILVQSRLPHRKCFCGLLIFPNWLKKCLIWPGCDRFSKNNMPVDEHVLSFLSTNFLVVTVVEIWNFLNYWSWFWSLYSEKAVSDFDYCEWWLLWKLLDDALERRLWERIKRNSSFFFSEVWIL